MRKFLKTCHVISRILLYLCVIGILLLYFFKPGVLSLAQNVFPNAGEGAWIALATTLSIAAVMFAASELSYKSLSDNEFMITLSSSVLKQSYGQYDLSDKRFSKPAAGEFEFNASLRDVTDEKERVMRELAWEKQHNKKLQKKTAGNKLVTLLFFLAGLAFFVYPLIVYFMTKNLMSLPTGTPMDYFAIVALILTMIIVFENGNNQGQIRRLNTILSIRSRSDELNEKPALPVSNQEPAYPGTAPIYEPKPAVNTAPVESVSERPENVAEPVQPQPPVQEMWKPDPVWTGVPEEGVTPQSSAFVNLTPEEETSAESEKD